MDASAAQAGLGDGECPALLAEQVVRWHPHVLVADVGVRALALGLGADPDVGAMFTPGVSAGTMNIDIPGRR